ncbi:MULTISPECIES: cupin domain-containing protein [unclassified Halomonas]|uniref:cupin domain-containing protein n=1 Tax=unclassified Halomonas TaxID=2609666 RepID=UPI002886526E|nr:MULTISPECIES: cupin domain-containing protein [unclassified Halomonas]MDT0500291.1 cupin domain-containing protein [Halomonas sp. PAR7]MDT0511214.1 cupin domain-containing protein [Halomonas sp. LES1]MDT0590497.1 cupin domain-containing protein [Halomonas sp. PAR8]
MSPETPLTMLGDLTRAEFLRDYWQQKPVLIRGAFPDFQCPLSPDELAGLACEEGIEARLVEEHGRDEQGQAHPWRVTHGPFSDATFAALPDRDWSLLVQAVDHYVPEVAELLERFTFLPRWRLDDIMISYAPPGGSVGPHVDQYDVFLLQGMGRRRWQLGGRVADDASIIPGIDLRILENFTVEPGDDWVLEPGDMLYLPPGWAHHGVSQSDDCLTLSVGFRAPSADESLASFADFLGDKLPDSLRYSDAGMTPPNDPGELDDAAIERMRHLLLDTLDDPARIAQWFGRVMTQPKYVDQLVPNEEPTDPAELVAALQQGEELLRSPGSRLAWRDLGEGRATLFADGDGAECELPLARLVASEAPLDAEVLAHEGAAILLAALLDAGSLAWASELEE